MDVRPRRVASELAARREGWTSAPEESRGNSPLRPVSKLTGAPRRLSRARAGEVTRVAGVRGPCVGSEPAVRAEAMDVRPRRVASELGARRKGWTSAPDESRVNSRLGPVSELTGARGRFSGRAEPGL